MNRLFSNSSLYAKKLIGDNNILFSPTVVGSSLRYASNTRLRKTTNHSSATNKTTSNNTTKPSQDSTQVQPRAAHHAWHSSIFSHTGIKFQKELRTQIKECLKSQPTPSYAPIAQLYEEVLRTRRSLHFPSQVDGILAALSAQNKKKAAVSLFKQYYKSMTLNFHSYKCLLQMAQGIISVEDTIEAFSHCFTYGIPLPRELDELFTNYLETNQKESLPEYEEIKKKLGVEDKPLDDVLICEDKESASLIAKKIGSATPDDKNKFTPQLNSLITYLKSTGNSASMASIFNAAAQNQMLNLRVVKLNVLNEQMEWYWMAQTTLHAEMKTVPICEAAERMLIFMREKGAGKEALTVLENELTIDEIVQSPKLVDLWMEVLVDNELLEKTIDVFYRLYHLKHSEAAGKALYYLLGAYLRDHPIGNIPYLLIQIASRQSHSFLSVDMCRLIMHHCTNFSEYAKAIIFFEKFAVKTQSDEICVTRAIDAQNKLDREEFWMSGLPQTPRYEKSVTYLRGYCDNSQQKPTTRMIESLEQLRIRNNFHGSAVIAFKKDAVEPKSDGKHFFSVFPTDDHRELLDGFMTELVNSELASQYKKINFTDVDDSLDQQIAQSQ